MLSAPGNSTTAPTTSSRVVIPFYAYAAIAFTVATVLLVLSTSDFSGHYFQPHLLAITHLMALGWGTMIILGASHQLVPVIIEAGLYSERLAYASFLLAAAGIPILVYAFYVFDMGWPAKLGAWLVLGAVLLYLVNLAKSITGSGKENVHAVFILTAASWLLLTIIIGLLLVYNFTGNFFARNSVDYLPLHAHIGIIGWFLLLITGVGSRLVPMFLISKYSNPAHLWWIYGCINLALLGFIALFLYSTKPLLFLLPMALLITGIGWFGRYCYLAYKSRIRKQVDTPMKLSLLAVILLFLPILIFPLVLLFSGSGQLTLIKVYGFTIFFGWLTAIILGMTFKTLPFIIWNKVYASLAGKGKTPTPKELYKDQLIRWMGLSYGGGLVLFTVGLLLDANIVVQAGAGCLLIASITYTLNIVVLLTHKPVLP